MKIVAPVVLILLLTNLFGWLTNLPQSVGMDVPQGKLNSLSFAPFWEGQGPMDSIFPSSAQLDADLRLMSEKTHSIRTYASAEGTMPEIPALARKYGLTMIQGAWLGGIKKSNKLEVNELIRSANANPDVVKRVIVGNEVLLRGDLEPEELIKYIREVKKAVKQPVSYADVWSMYMKHPELIKEVDFITIHILPYWEDEPIAVELAPAHIERIYKHVQQEARSMGADKPILIGESGWPSAGRQRGWAVPSVINEAKFIRGLIAVANANGFDYNIVEAINQSWKSELEGVVGANWGLFSTDRQEVFPLTGEVYEKPNWHQSYWVAGLIFLVAVAVCRKPLQRLSPRPLFALLAFAQILIVLWISQIEWLWYTSYNSWQRLLTLLIISLSAVIAGLITQRSYNVLAKNTAHTSLVGWLYHLYSVFVGYAVIKTFFLAISGRYLSFPLLPASITVIGIVGLWMMHATVTQSWSLKTCSIQSLLTHSNNKPEQNEGLGYALLATGLMLVVGETWEFVQSRDLILAYPSFFNRLVLSLQFTLTNGQLALWLLCLLVLALPLLVRVNKYD